MSNIKFEYREAAGHVETLAASTMAEAIEEAKDLLRNGDWDTSKGTVWPIASVVKVEVDDEGDEVDVDHETVSVSIDPPEPGCSEGEHDWQAPYSILGGLKEDPGVFGQGGGMIIREVCAHCGTYRERDTGARNPTTGEHGLGSVAYEDANEESLTWVQNQKNVRAPGGG